VVQKFNRRQVRRAARDKHAAECMWSPPRPSSPPPPPTTTLSASSASSAKIDE